MANIKSVIVVVEIDSSTTHWLKNWPQRVYSKNNWDTWNFLDKTSIPKLKDCLSIQTIETIFEWERSSVNRFSGFFHRYERNSDVILKGGSSEPSSERINIPYGACNARTTNGMQPATRNPRTALGDKSYRFKESEAKWALFQNSFKIKWILWYEIPPKPLINFFFSFFSSTRWTFALGCAHLEKQPLKGRHE